MKRPSSTLSVLENRKLLPSEVSRRRAFAGDVDKGLSLHLPVVNYTSNKETKEFLEREAAKLEPGFKRASGTRYLLNRWREAQLASGNSITYQDLVKHTIELNKTKQGPLRIEHARYINFISDFMAANKSAQREQAVKAWEELKAMNAPKIYESWTRAHIAGKTQRIVSGPKFQT